MTATNTKKSAETKPETILRLVRRKNGATLKVLRDATGWQPHSVRAAVSGLRKNGHAIECAKDAKGASIYRVVK